MVGFFSSFLKELLGLLSFWSEQEAENIQCAGHLAVFA